MATEAHGCLRLEAAVLTLKKKLRLITLVASQEQDPRPSVGIAYGSLEVTMKNALAMTILLSIACAALPSQDAPAATSTQRARTKALAECHQKAMAMGLMKKTIRRKNFVMDCMTDRGFQG